MTKVNEISHFRSNFTPRLREVDLDRSEFRGKNRAFSTSNSVTDDFLAFFSRPYHELQKSLVFHVMTDSSLAGRGTAS